MKASVFIQVWSSSFVIALLWSDAALAEPALVAEEVKALFSETPVKEKPASRADAPQGETLENSSDVRGSRVSIEGGVISSSLRLTDGSTTANFPMKSGSAAAIRADFRGDDASVGWVFGMSYDAVTRAAPTGYAPSTFEQKELRLEAAASWSLGNQFVLASGLAFANETSNQLTPNDLVPDRRSLQIQAELSRRAPFLGSWEWEPRVKVAVPVVVSSRSSAGERVHSVEVEGSLRLSTPIVGALGATVGASFGLSSSKFHGASNTGLSNASELRLRARALVGLVIDF